MHCSIKRLCKLLGLQYEIQYKKGCNNVVVDALSRRPGLDKEGAAMAVTEVMPSWLQKLQVSYKNDTWAQEILQGKEDQENTKRKISLINGVIRVKGRIYVGNTEDWRAKVVLALHNSSVGGHSGIQGTYHRVHKLFYWPKLKESVIQIVQSCHTCQLNKGENIAYLGLL
jgi:Integrase zinc binding domain